METGLYLGYEGSPGQGVKIIVGADQSAKLWDIEPDNLPDYKYDDTVLSLYRLSSTSFDRIRVHGTRWLIAFDKNYYPGIPTTLEWEKIPEEINQVWDFSSRTSQSQELLRRHSQNIS